MSDLFEANGIELRSGKTLGLRKPDDAYSDSDSDDGSYGYLCDDDSYVEESTEREIMSRVCVPIGYGESFSEFVKKFHDCRNDRVISFDQFRELVETFGRWVNGSRGERRVF